MALPKLLREIFENDGAGPKFRADKIPVTQVTVDSALSSTSENPVQNKVINSALDRKLSLSGGRMTGSISFGGSISLAISAIDDTSSLVLAGGTSAAYAAKAGAALILSGKKDITGGIPSGNFSLSAADGTSLTTLRGTPDGSLTWPGTFSATTLKATSDKRKKTCITKMSTDLSSLSAYRYKFKEPSEVDKGFHVGLIAQEVEKVLPEAVSKDDKGFLTLDYNAVVAVLVDEVNQLKSEIKQLKAKLS